MASAIKVTATEVTKAKTLLEHGVKKRDIAEILNLSWITIDRIAHGAYDWKLTGDEPSELYKTLVRGMKSPAVQAKQKTDAAQNKTNDGVDFAELEAKLDKMVQLNSRMLSVMAEILESSDAICRAWNIEKRRTYQEKKDEQKEEAGKSGNTVSY